MVWDYVRPKSKEVRRWLNFFVDSLFMDMPGSSVSVFIIGIPLDFMFHIQTNTYYMTQIILVGGAKYRATGRGFFTQRTPMDE